MSKTNKILTNVARIGFAGWLAFELLNYFQILHFTLDFTWLGLVMTASVVWASIEIISWAVKRKVGEPLPWFVFVGCLFNISVDALGDVNHWYVGYGWYDQLAHGLGGGMAALMVFMVIWMLDKAGKIKLAPGLIGAFAFSATAALGVFYELEEYIEDVITGGNRLGDGPDTANDLMWNVIGALVVVYIMVLIIKRITRKKEVREEEGDK